MRPRSMGILACFAALLALLTTCQSQSSGSGGRDPQSSDFPEALPETWDGRTDYAESAFFIQ